MFSRNLHQKSGIDRTYIIEGVTYKSTTEPPQEIQTLMSGNQPQAKRSGPRGKSWREAISEVAPDDPEGRTWGQILHGLNEEEEASEERYHRLTRPFRAEEMENIPYPEPVPKGLNHYGKEPLERKEFWVKAQEKIWPHLTLTERKVFLRIIRTPQIQKWEIAKSLGLSYKRVLNIIRDIEKKVEQIYGNS